MSACLYFAKYQRFLATCPRLTGRMLTRYFSRRQREQAMKQSTSNLEAQTLKQNAEAKLSSVDAVLTLAEVSAILNISLEATKQLFDTGVIAGISLNQRHAVCLRSDLIKYLRETSDAQTKVRRELCSPSSRLHVEESRLAPPERSQIEAARRGPRQRPLPILAGFSEKHGVGHA